MGKRECGQNSGALPILVPIGLPPTMQKESGLFPGWNTPFKIRPAGGFFRLSGGTGT